jgi:hypothetical protein
MRRLLPVAICAVLVLGGCGSDTDTASAPSSTTQPTATVPERAPQGAAGQEGGKEADGTSSKGAAKDSGSSPQSTATVKVPPISSAPVAGSKAPAPGVKTVKGADDSVQTYGVESGQAARTEAAITLQAYLNARLKEDWGSACSYLAQRPKQELEKLARSASRQGKETAGCAGAMAILGEGASGPRQSEEATITEVLSFRGEGNVPGDPSYLIFKGPPGTTLYSMPMYLEGGGWKVGLALPAELPV